jgi:hypothetical protein
MPLKFCLKTDKIYQTKSVSVNNEIVSELKRERGARFFYFSIVSIPQKDKNFPSLLVQTSYLKRQRHPRGMALLMS